MRDVPDCRDIEKMEATVHTRVVEVVIQKVEERAKQPPRIGWDVEARPGLVSSDALVFGIGLYGLGRRVNRPMSWGMNHSRSDNAVSVCC